MINVKICLKRCPLECTIVVEIPFNEPKHKCPEKLWISVLLWVSSLVTAKPGCTMHSVSSKTFGIIQVYRWEETHRWTSPYPYSIKVKIEVHEGEVTCSNFNSVTSCGNCRMFTTKAYF